MHIPPRASDDEARAVVRALTARGVESFVIRDEPALLHGVSLGVFRDAQSAQELMDRMQGIGYPVAVHEKSRTRRAFFLLGALAADAGAVVAPALDEAVATAAAEARVAPAGLRAVTALHPRRAPTKLRAPPSGGAGGQRRWRSSIGRAADL